jgi:hypothetical protein
MTELPVQQMQLEADDVRVTAYYDEHGRATNVDVVLNVDEVTSDDVNSIVANLRELPRAAVPPGLHLANPNIGSTNGGQTLLFGNDELSRPTATTGP